MELAPEFWRHVGVGVHADEDFGGLKLFEGMLDAVGDVGRHTCLCLHAHVRPSTILGDALQQLLALFHVAAHVLAVIDHIERHQTAIEFAVAYEQSKAHELLGKIGIAHGNEDAFVVFARHVLGGSVFVAQNNLLCGLLRSDARDDTGEENHDHHRVEHLCINQHQAVDLRQTHAHHHHGDGAGSVG